jgi:hypothetical protein
LDWYFIGLYVGLGVNIESSVFLDGSDEYSQKIEINYDEFRGFVLTQGNSIITLTHDQAEKLKGELDEH